MSFYDRSWTDAWKSHAEPAEAPPPRRARRPRRGRSALLASALLAASVAPLALGGAGGETGVALAGNQTGEPIEIGIRNRSRAETGMIANNDGYSLRFSNKQEGQGGGLVSGCRSAAGQESCIYADNLRDGTAFLFRVRRGSVGGRIEVGGPNAKPFTTNATGVADGLNADRVDGHDVGCPTGAREIASRCYDAAPRAAATAAAASDVCRTAGGRLPTPLELRAIRGEQDVDLGAAAANADHVTDSLHYDDGTAQVVAAADDGGTRPVPADEAHPYRCTYDLVR
jgi:hypothetical protein